MPPTELPIEYLYRQRTHLLVNAQHADEAVRVLLKDAPDGEPMAAGRGGATSVPFGDGFAVLRPHRRGGLIRFFLHDAYLFRNRPRAEFIVHAAAYALGAPVPEPLGVRWTREGGLFRGALLTRHLPAEPLSLVSHRTPVDDAPHRLAGAAVARFHDAGVLHADLNAHNILVDSAGSWIIDLDRARVVSSPTPADRARNLLRLRRSYAKLGIPMERFVAFMDGYGPIDIPRCLRACHTLRQAITGKAP